MTKPMQFSKQYHYTFPNDPTSLLNMASIHVRRGEIDEALSILQALEKDVHTKRLKGYREYFYSGMASIYLVKNDIDVAFHYASLALRESPRSNYIWAIYGAVLIEKGSDKNGMRWLFKIMDFEYPNPLAMCASMYLMVAFHQRGDMRSRELHLNFVKRNMGLLDADGRIILNRNLEKIGEPAMIGDM
jgi:predicted Zn-dependent protease